MRSLRLSTLWTTAVVLSILAWGLGSPPAAGAALQGRAALRHLHQAGLYDGLKAAFAAVVQEAELDAADGASSDLFGISVAIDADTAVVGAIADDDLGTDSGSAYVFVRSGTSWSQQAKLTAADGATGDQFGERVAIRGDTVVVGADLDDDLGSNSGSAYVFVRSGTSWSQQQKLTAGDGAAGDVFGFSVSIDGDTAVAGAQLDDDLGTDSGSAYVFARSAGSWSQQQKLIAADGAAGDRFGVDVEIDGNTVLVGALFGDGAATDSGAAYVFAPANAPPDCSGASPSVASLWPPNHQLVAVSIQGVTDPDGDPVTITIDQIRQDEATDGLGDGNTCPDGTGVGTATAHLRAERSALGNGRVYTVSFTASDGQGGSCQGSVTVCVPVSQSGSGCVDGGAVFDSTACGGPQH